MSTKKLRIIGIHKTYRGKIRLPFGFITKLEIENDSIINAFSTSDWLLEKSINLKLSRTAFLYMTD